MKITDLKKDQCLKVNNKFWHHGLKMIVTRVYVNGNVSLKSVTIGFKNITVKLTEENFKEYTLEEAVY